MFGFVKEEEVAQLRARLEAVTARVGALENDNKLYCPAILYTGRGWRHDALTFSLREAVDALLYKLGLRLTRTVGTAPKVVLEAREPGKPRKGRK